MHDRKPMTLNQACSFAEEYFASHRWSILNYLGAGKWAGQQQREYGRFGGQGERKDDRKHDYKPRNYCNNFNEKENKDSEEKSVKKEEVKEEGKKAVYKPPHRRWPKQVACHKCKKMGHIAKYCRNVQYIETEGACVLARKVVFKGKIAGKPVANIMLDTGAEMSGFKEACPKGNTRRG